MARSSLQFDKVVSSGRRIPVRTNLRAVAGFMAVVESGTPEGPASSPLATTQVGGDVAYTSGGVVTEASTGQVVGKSVNDGVLDQPNAASRQGKEFRGTVDGNDTPEAMSVFSSYASDTYDLTSILV